MSKIFKYELKRILTSWLFLALLVVNGMYNWYLLTTDIILGIAYTAPFSVWSFCTYMGKCLPTIVATVLLLLAGFYGKKQKRVEILIGSTPVTFAQMMVLRTYVLTVCFGLLCFVAFILAFIFYAFFFQRYGFVDYLLPLFFMVIPCFIFVISAGHLLGRLHQGLVYLLLLVLCVMGFMNMTNPFDLFGNGYFAAYPLELPVGGLGEPDFAMGGTWLLARGMYLVLGVALFICNMKVGDKATRA